MAGIYDLINGQPAWQVAVLEAQGQEQPVVDTSTGWTPLYPTPALAYGAAANLQQPMTEEEAQIFIERQAEEARVMGEQVPPIIRAPIPIITHPTEIAQDPLGPQLIYDSPYRWECVRRLCR